MGKLLVPLLNVAMAGSALLTAATQSPVVFGITRVQNAWWAHQGSHHLVCKPRTVARTIGMTLHPGIA